MNLAILLRIFIKTGSLLRQCAIKNHNLVIMAILPLVPPFSHTPQTVPTPTLPLEDDEDGRADHDLHLHLTLPRPQKHQKEQGELLPSQLLFGDSLYEDLTDPDDQGNPQDWLSTNAPISLTEDHVEEIERKELDCRIFVNRTAELKALFIANAECNINSWEGQHQVQDYSIPVAAMTYGAGKSVLGINYLSHMRKWLANDSLDPEQQTALKELERYRSGNHYDQLRELCADSTVALELSGRRSLDELIDNLVNALKRHVPDYPINGKEGQKSAARSMISEIRKTRSLFIHVDEIGGLSTKDLQLLKEFFGSIYVATRGHPETKPLHLHVCGRVSRDIAHKMPLSSSTHQHSHEG